MFEQLIHTHCYFHSAIYQLFIHSKSKLGYFLTINSPYRFDTTGMLLQLIIYVYVYKPLYPTSSTRSKRCP